MTGHAACFTSASIATQRLRPGVVTDDHDRDIGSSLDRRLPDLFQPDRAVDDVVSEADDHRGDLREPVRPLMGDQDLEFRRRFGPIVSVDCNTGSGTSG